MADISSARPGKASSGAPPHRMDHELIYFSKRYSPIRRDSRDRILLATKQKPAFPH
jgi:hypothetical protein